MSRDLGALDRRPFLNQACLALAVHRVLRLHVVMCVPRLDETRFQRVKIFHVGTHH